MDTRFEWQDEFNIGVELIDQEHQRLFKIINKLLRFQDEEKDSQFVCQEGIKYFKGHALKHFADEEAYMESIGYEDLEQHKRIHRGFQEYTLPALEEEMERTNYSVEAMEHFLGVCAGWLVGHTLTEDQAITGKQSRRWAKLLPGEEMAAIEKVVTQLVFDMFHLESQMVSDAYHGEKFGTGVYYRLVYGMPGEQKQQQIILSFEEKLLINTVGRVIGIQTGKLDTMLIHATRYTARQFAQRVTEQIPAMDGYDLKEENLLSYEQLQAIFQREPLQVSLLFNTGGAGYFAFSVIAPHLLEEHVDTTPIEADNAMAEVEQYLMKREEQNDAAPRSKILVVDDSMTIRQGMKRLLEPDYEVALAESGIAAIRTITLNRPDLVLLDYEMPVCDGRQTLEMLRSAPEFADVPVIFLTGRSDPDSVRKVMTLKPAGYLLKYLKPEEIKQKIDAFFAKQNG